MSTKTLALALAIALSIALPLASANHGLNGRLVGQLSDGTPVEAKLTYVSGNYNTQTWRFAFTVGTGTSFTCNGFGSLEIGFTSVSCATGWSTGATGDSHAYPASSADVHTITFAIAGVPGTGAQAVCADSGPAGTACNTALGTAPL